MEPRVHFYLDRAISKERINELDVDQRKEVLQILKSRPLQIWTSLTFLKNQRVKVYTGERIEQAYWDAEKQRVNPSKYKYGAHDFNVWLNSIEEKIIKEIRESFRFSQKEVPTKENVTVLIKRIVRESKEIIVDPKTPSISEIIEQYRDKYKLEWTKGFLQIVDATREHLKSFESLRGDPLTTYDNYNEVWSDFKAYLIGKNFNNSTANKYLKIFRRLIRYMVDTKIISEVTIKDLTLLKTIESFRIALKEREIELLANKVFEKPHLNKARDLMLIQVFSGQRVSDLPQVLDQIKGGGQIHITQHKTKKRVTIPMYPLLEKHLKEIALRNPEGLEIFSEQKYNEYIKLCCKDADINQNHTWVELLGDERTTKVEPRYNLVSSHTCRRTFATISKKKGISDKAIMAVTGHTSHKMFLEYIRTDDEDVNDEFNQKMV